MPPPTTTTSRPGRLLLTLVVLIVILLLGVLAGSAFQPGIWHKRFRVGLGLDLSSGTSVTLQAIPPQGSSNKVPPADLATAVSIMNSRVNGAGFNGATVVPQGSDLINVTVPGKGVQQVVNLVGTTAQLRFRQVLLTAPNYATSSSSGQKLATTADPSAQGQASRLTPAVRAQFDKLNCADSNWRTQIYGNNPNNWDNPGVQTVTCFSPGPGQPVLKYALDKAYVTGKMLKLGGSSTQLQTNGSWFAVSDVQNFAFTLGLPTLVDVMVVFLFTKPMITLLARTRFFGGGHRLSGLDPARLGARSPWRGTRRPAARQQPGRPQPGSAQARNILLPR